MSAPEELSTVAVNWPDYTGKWYAVAQLPNGFQGSNPTNVVATYRQNPNGTIQVTNSQTDPDGKVDKIQGLARVVGPGKLKVQFPGVPKQGNYWIVDALQDATGAYTASVVTSPDRQTLWVLSRSPEGLSPSESAQIDAKLDELGFDRSKLTPVQQTGNSTAAKLAQDIRARVESVILGLRDNLLSLYP